MTQAQPTARAATLEYASPASAPAARFDRMALATHLAGWCLIILVFWVISVYVVPRFEQLYAAYTVGLPRLTKNVLELSAGVRDGPALVLLIALGLAHSFGAAWWYQRAADWEKLAYRLILMLLLAAAVMFVLFGLCFPLFTAMLPAAPPAPVSAPTPAPAA